MIRRSAASTRSTSSSSSAARSPAAEREAAEQPGLQDEQLAAGLARVEPGLLQRDADPPPGRVGIGGHVDTGDVRRARRDRHERRQHPDGRRLAGPVGPEEAEHLARGDLQVDAAHRFHHAAAAAVVLDELVGIHRESHDSSLWRATDSPSPLARLLNRICRLSPAGSVARRMAPRTRSPDGPGESPELIAGRRR